MESNRNYSIKKIFIQLISLVVLASCDPIDAMDPPIHCKFIVNNDTDVDLIVPLQDLGSWIKFDEGEEFSPGATKEYFVRIRRISSPFLDVWYYHNWPRTSDPSVLFYEKLENGEVSWIRTDSYAHRSEPGNFFNEESWTKREWPDPYEERYYHYEWTLSLKALLGK